jgi:hypothetical protein
MKIVQSGLKGLPLFLVANRVYGHSEGEGDCTKGMLYVSDTDSSTLHVYNLSQSLDQPLPEVQTIANLTGGPGQAVEATANGLHVMSTYWGSEETDYQDGYVNFINTGVTADDHGDHAHLNYAEPTVLTNVFLACGPVWHPAHHADYLALFCDGSFDNGVNTSYYILSEESLSDNPEDPFVYSGTIPGSHHGIAIPIDADHLFHSLPTFDRLNRVNGSDSLPDTFQIVSYDDGSIVRSLNDTSSADSHCKAYHGGTAIENTIYLCCEDQVLVVEYNPESGSFATRSLTFPDTISAAHRCGSNHATPQSDYVVTDYADWDAETYAPHLLAFPKDATELSDADVLVLGEEGQCQYAFEQADSEHLVLLLPNGTVQAYSYGRPDGWALVGEVVIDGISTCDDATMVAGYGQAFVAVAAAKIVYSVDLSHLGHDHGDGGDHGLSAVPTEVSYSPGSMTISGVPRGTACVSEEEVVEGGSGTGGTSSAAANTLPSATTALLFGCALASAWLR